MSLGFHPKGSGDVMVITKSNYFIEAAPFKNNTTPGTVYSYSSSHFIGIALKTRFYIASKSTPAMS